MNGRRRGEFCTDLVVVHYPPNIKEIKTIQKCSDLAWNSSISDCLHSRGFEYARDCQTVSWPALSDNKSISLLSVAGPQQGKTSGWVLPVLDKLTSDALYRKLPKGIGPRVCVLCDGHDSAIQIEWMLKDIISEAKLDVNVCVGSRGNRIDPLKLNIELVNGADILIISPTALAQHQEELSMNLQRCCHLVIESADKTLQNHGTAVERFLLRWRRQRNLLSSLPEIPEQVVVVAQEWNQSLVSFRKVLIKENLEPVMIFADLVEAAVFSGVQFEPSYHETLESKLDHLCVEIPKGSPEKKVICCPGEIQEEIERVLAKSSRVFVLDDDSDAYDVKETMRTWRESVSSSLVISDFQLNNLFEVPDQTVSLVHLGLEDINKKLFQKRFKFMMKQLKTRSEGKVHIMFGPEDRKCFGSIRSLLKRCSNSHQIPQDIFTKLSFEDSQELCSSFVEAQTCRSLSCKSRHRLDAKMDQNIRSHLGKEVKFRVLKVLSPVRFRVVLSSPDLDKRNFQRKLRMDSHFLQAENVVALSRAEIIEGLEVGVKEEEEDLVRRGRVRVAGEKEVEVELYDIGEVKKVRPEDVLRLPYDLQTVFYPAGSVEVTVLGLSPLYRDPDWSQLCSNLVREVRIENILIFNHLSTEIVGQGLVLLHTRSVLWLDRCKFSKFSRILNTWVVHLDLQSDLVELGWAEADTKFRDFLLDLALKAGLEITKPRHGEQKLEDKSCSLSKEKELNASVAELSLGEEETEETEMIAGQLINREIEVFGVKVQAFFNHEAVASLGDEDVDIEVEVEEEEDEDIELDIRHPAVPSSKVAEVELSLRPTAVTGEDGFIRFLNVIWHQDPDSVHISISCKNLLQLEERDVFIDLKEETLIVEVSLRVTKDLYQYYFKITEHRENSTITHILRDSPLKLWSLSEPNSVDVKIMNHKIRIKFKKKSSHEEWPRLSSVKLDWIRFNFDSLNFDFEENNNIEDYPEVKKDSVNQTIPLPYDTDTESENDNDSLSDPDEDVDDETNVDFLEPENNPDVEAD